MTMFSDLIDADVLNLEPAPGLDVENDNVLPSDMMILQKRG